jgi:hypothetical protein
MRVTTRTDMAWPMYFAAKPLTKGKVTYRKGDAFQLQDKGYIRGLGIAYGVPDADRLPFGSLPYVETVNVRDRRNMYQIIQTGMNADAARKLVSGGVSDG